MATVINEVAPNVWTFSRSFARFGILPVGGRSTAVKLTNGGVWVLASTPLDTETKAKIDELGPVQYILSADAGHHLFLAEFKKAYPTAKLLAPITAAVREKSLTFDGVWGRDPPDTKYGFEEDIEACFFSGWRNKDLAFFHPASKTMIEADLLFNLPNFGPSSWLHKKIVGGMVEDKAAMKRDVKTVADWDFTRIIPCHGPVIETGAKQAWLELYKAFVDPAA